MTQPTPRRALAFSKARDRFTAQAQAQAWAFVAQAGSRTLALPPPPGFVPLAGDYFIGDRSQLGTFLALARNAIQGVAYGFFVRFAFKGVGFKVQSPDRRSLAFDLGCSHYLVYTLPPTVYFRKLRKYEFVLFSADRAQLLETCHQVQGLRYPDPYKGKGIHHGREFLFTKSRNKDAKRR